MKNYAVASLDEIDVIDDGRSPFRPVRHHLGIQSFGINAWTAKDVGDRLINEHDEEGPNAQEELYVVLTGRARFELDGETVDAPTGTLVYAKPSAKRTAFAEEAGTTLVALGGTPGKAYTVQGWEVWAPLNRYYQAGEYAEAAERGRVLADEHPEYSGLLYNVACCEALAGDKERAIEHLRASLAAEADDSLAKFAKTDTDFDSLRDEPAFKELVG
jgi:tetratricopeptide (TPR) repeat protein